MKIRIAAGVLSVVLLAAACSSTPAAAPVTSTVTAVSTATATISEPPSTVVSTVLSTVPTTVVSTVRQTVTVSPKPAPTTTATTVPLGSSKPLGQAFDFNIVKVTALETKIPMTVGDHEPSAGQQFAGVLAQTCIQNSSTPTTISWRPWVLEDADGGQYPAAESAYEDTPKPEYPFAGTTTYVNGDCAKGWIVFELPKTAKLTQVRYSVSDPEFGALLGLWSIKS